MFDGAAKVLPMPSNLQSRPDIDCVPDPDTGSARRDVLEQSLRNLGDPFLVRPGDVHTRRDRSPWFASLIGHADVIGKAFKSERNRRSHSRLFAVR